MNDPRTQIPTDPPSLVSGILLLSRPRSPGARPLWILCLRPVVHKPLMSTWKERMSSLPPLHNGIQVQLEPEEASQGTGRKDNVRKKGGE